jgi:oligoendopeptidase F
MQEAVDASLPHWHRYLRAKAELLGHTDGLPWWDLLAPVGRPKRFEWPQATAAVHEAFATYSPRLAGLVETAVAESWIDAEPRAGKVGGAYCMSITDGVTTMVVTHRVSGDATHKLDAFAPVVDRVNALQFGNLARAAGGTP